MRRSRPSRLRSERAEREVEDRAAPGVAPATAVGARPDAPSVVAADRDLHGTRTPRRRGRSSARPAACRRPSTLPPSRRTKRLTLYVPLNFWPFFAVAGHQRSVCERRRRALEPPQCRRRRPAAARSAAVTATAARRKCVMDALPSQGGSVDLLRERAPQRARKIENGSVSKPTSASLAGRAARARRRHRDRAALAARSSRRRRRMTRGPGCSGGARSPAAG